MSYKNPKIIVDRSAQILQQGFQQFGENVLSGIDKYVATIKEQQKTKNMLDIAHVEAYGDLSKEIPQSLTAREDILSLINESLELTKNSNYELNTNLGLDKERRQELLKTISDQKIFRDHVKNVVPEFEGGVKLWMDTPASSVGFNNWVSGNTNDEVANNTFILNAMSDRIPGAKANFARKGNSLVLNTSGNIAGVSASASLNMDSYMKMVNDGQDIVNDAPQTTKEIIKSTEKILKNDEGTLLPKYLKGARTIPVGDGLERTDQVVDGEAILESIGITVSNKVKSYVDSPSLIGGYWNYTLGNWDNNKWTDVDKSDMDKIADNMATQQASKVLENMGIEYDEKSSQYFMRGATTKKAQEQENIPDTFVGEVFKGIQNDPAYMYSSATGYQSKWDANNKTFTIMQEYEDPDTNEISLAPKVYDLSEPANLAFVYNLILEAQFGAKRGQAGAKEFRQMKKLVDGIVENINEENEFATPAQPAFSFDDNTATVPGEYRNLITPPKR
jgi:hypothetical protein